MLDPRRRSMLGVLIMLLIAAFAAGFFISARNGAFSGIRSNFTRDFGELKTQVRVFQENIADSLSPPRAKPHSLYPVEETLIATLPPFESFNDQDWEDFWNVIYGLHITGDYPDYIQPPRKRQLEFHEIEDMLIRYYPGSFGNYDQNAWDTMWKIILKRKFY